MIKIPVMINDIKATIIMERLPNYRRFRGQLINSLKQETSLVKLEVEDQQQKEKLYNLFKYEKDLPRKLYNKALRFLIKQHERGY